MTEKNSDTKSPLDVVIVGGGLVGSLEALYLAKRGHHVRLYEYREDIRKTPQIKGRSINLALSVRGRRALRDVGLEDRMVKEHGIPMKGRMIHRLDGTTYVIPYDGRTKQCIYSVGRNYLNGLLLKESENYKNVERYFNHKLTEANLQNGTLSFFKWFGHVERMDDERMTKQIYKATVPKGSTRRGRPRRTFDNQISDILKDFKTDTKETIQVKTDLIIGADGAFSAVRKSMMKQPLFDYSQKYIEHGYLELCIPATEDGGFKMPPNYLHIWPRGNFMMIALPNQDCSWTVTLFMPFENFKDLHSKEKLYDFFEKYFPDSVPFIGKDKLVEDFFGGSPSTLVAVKCRPYHVLDKALLLGDAAHAVVPFYGQGMNAGFEDCALLDQLFQKYSNNLQEILNEFSDTRWKDTHAISDLAMYNYIEMRDLVTRPSYRLRKSIDDFVFWLFPTFWVPLYNSVTFTTMPYSECVKNRKWQDMIMKKLFYFAGILTCVGSFYYLRNVLNND